MVTDLRGADENAANVLEAAANLGLERVRIDGYPLEECFVSKIYAEAAENLSSLIKLLKKFKIKGAIQTHSGYCLECNISSTMRLVEKFDPEWVGIQYDSPTEPLRHSYQF